MINAKLNLVIVEAIKKVRKIIIKELIMVMAMVMAMAMVMVMAMVREEQEKEDR